MGQFLERMSGRIKAGSPSSGFQLFTPVGGVIDSAGVIGGPNLITFDAVVVTSPITPTVANGLFVRLTLSNNGAYTLNVPSGTVASGAHLQVMVRNIIGGAAGVMTFAAGYKLGAAWAQPATAFSRSIDFTFDGTNWVETGRSAADVSN